MKSTRTAILAIAFLALVSCAQTEESRNIAFHRAAYHSSATDYYYTAQLVTDGIVEDGVPVYYEVLENGSPAPKYKKEAVFQHRRAVHYKVTDPHYELSILEHGIHQEVDAMRLNMALRYKADRPATLPTAEILATKDGGASWESVHKLDLDLIPRKETALSFGIEPDPARNGYRLILDGREVGEWVLLEWDFFKDGKRLDVVGNEEFHSFWVAEDAGTQWLTVDLGAVSTLERSVFHWSNRPAGGRILASKDGRKWHKLAVFGVEDELPLKGKGRYIKMEMEPASNGEPIAMGEWEIWGSNDLKAPESAWKLARASEADKPEAWIPAKVPGTVLVSYMDFGAVPDISYANDQEYISDSYFNSDFIYRGTLPFEGAEGRKVFLDFGGINWKAEVSLNGRALGRIDGAFTRARFDVTDIVRKGDNEVEVLIHRPAHPGAAKGSTLSRIPPNGGVLGADNPTFHASIGWDWIPTVRGRNIGIWRDVRFSTKGDVTVSDPLVQTVLNLPETSVADVTVEALLRNTASEARKVLWQGKIGEASFEVPVELAAGEERSVSKTIRMENPRLWWPNRYGEAYLYDASVAVLQDGSVSDELAFKAGLRQLSYSTEDGRLTAWVNGTRVAGLGGNWGFSELNLRYTARDYDIAVGYHKQMNFTMIRNWVGQTADEEFYEACDRHGIMVWQDFWLANPSDGPDPDDEKLFMDNAEDYVRKIRRHPSVVLYCGRNEGMPPASLDAELRKLLAREHSDIFYISHSSRGLVSGEGPYFRHSSSQYFNLRGQDRMHSERGATNVPNYETLLRFIPADKLWPQNDMWGVHDFAIENAQHVDKFNAAVVSRFGEPASAKQFCDLAQWVDYDGFRAVFESRSNNRRGILLWMSHNAWPSLVWCPYDYFFDGDAAYFASKKACELVHIQYNAFSGKLEVTNWGADGFGSLQARAALLDMHGAQIRSYDFELPSLPGDSTFEGPSVELPAGKVSFLKLGLMDGETLLSENFYVLGDPEDDFRALNELPAAKVCKSWKLSEDAEGYTVSVEIENTGSEPAMMLRLKLLNNAPVNSGPAPTGLSTSAFGSTPDDYRILPVDWSDNYFHLLPGEKKCVTARVLKRHFDIALKPRLELSGFNL